MPDNVDIVMPHGPPAFQESTTYTLGANKNGKHCGCSKLAQALKRAQPKLACFGHIHDGRGVMDRNWQTNTIEPYPIDKVDTFDMINIAAQFEGKRC